MQSNTYCKTRRKSGLTRREALEAALVLVADSSLTPKSKEEILYGLRLCLTELPFAHWTEEAVFDACDQFLLDHGRPPRMRDFGRSGLPGHPTVKNRFGLSLQQFLDRYYPGGRELSNRSPYGDRSTLAWADAFMREYCRLSPKSAADFNARRKKGLPGWNTVAKMLGVKTWRGLLDYCGFSPASSTTGTPDYRVLSDSPSLRKLAELRRRMEDCAGENADPD